MVWIAGCCNSLLRAVKQSKEQSMSHPHFWSTFWRKRSRFEHMPTVIQRSRRLDSFLHEAAQNFELLSNVKDKKLKITKTYCGWCPFQGLSNGTALMQIQSGRTVPLSLSRFTTIKVNKIVLILRAVLTLKQQISFSGVNISYLRHLFEYIGTQFPPPSSLLYGKMGSITLFFFFKWEY